MPNATAQGQIGEAQVKEYWAHGKGHDKWIGSPHPYITLHALLPKYVSARTLDGLTVNILKLATGHYPGQRKDGQRLCMCSSSFRSHWTLGQPVMEP